MTDANDGDVFWDIHSENPKTLLHIEAFDDSVQSTEPRVGGCIVEETEDHDEKSNVVVVGRIGRSAAFVCVVRRWKLTLPAARTVPGLSSRTSDDASLETADEPVIGSFFYFRETISRTSILIYWNHIVIERIRSKMNYMRIRNKSENGPLISEIWGWKFQLEGRQD